MGARVSKGPRSNASENPLQAFSSLQSTEYSRLPGQKGLRPAVSTPNLYESGHRAPHPLPRSHAYPPPPLTDKREDADVYSAVQEHSEQPCTRHPGSQKLRFCKDCHDYLCLQCASEHEFRSGHAVIEISKFHEELDTVIHAYLANVTRQKATLCNQKADIEMQLTCMEQDIRTFEGFLGTKPFLIDKMRVVRRIPMRSNNSETEFSASVPGFSSNENSRNNGYCRNSEEPSRHRTAANLPQFEHVVQLESHSNDSSAMSARMLVPQPLYHNADFQRDGSGNDDNSSMTYMDVPERGPAAPPAPGPQTPNPRGQQLSLARVSRSSSFEGHHHTQTAGHAVSQSQQTQVKR